MPYSGDPAASDADMLRFLIGDTDTGAAQFSDPEIASLLDTYGTPQRAAIAACDRLIARYARRVSKSMGPLSVQWSDLLDHYKALRDTLRDSAVSDSPVAPVWVGTGADGTTRGPIFTVHQFERISDATPDGGQS